VAGDEVGSGGATDSREDHRDYDPALQGFRAHLAVFGGFAGEVERRPAGRQESPQYWLVGGPNSNQRALSPQSR
jgi:hypothetical protein